MAVPRHAGQGAPQGEDGKEPSAMKAAC